MNIAALKDDKRSHKYIKYKEGGGDGRREVGMEGGRWRWKEGDGDGHTTLTPHSAWLTAS